MKFRLEIKGVSIAEGIDGIAGEIFTDGDMQKRWTSGRYQVRVGKVLYTDIHRTKKGRIFVSYKQENDLGGYRTVQRGISPTTPITLVSNQKIKNIKIG